MNLFFITSPHSISLFEIDIILHVIYFSAYKKSLPSFFLFIYSHSNWSNYPILIQSLLSSPEDRYLFQLFYEIIHQPLIALSLNNRSGFFIVKDLQYFSNYFCGWPLRISFVSWVSQVPTFFIALFLLSRYSKRLTS